MNLTSLTITQAHKKLTSKEISSVELTKACLEQIRHKDSEIQAFITVTEELALQQAAEADKKIASGEATKLTGIPYSLKDAICYEGIETTAGSNMLKGYIPPQTSTAIEQIQAQGAVMIGKVNCDAFGHGGSTENSDYMVTKNPWDLERVAGGSSGGSAAAVAANMGLFSIGEDTGGSIRQPASFCGVTGLKTSYGRVSRYGIVAYASSLDTLGPIAKTAEDTALIMETLAGYDELDPTTLQKEVPQYSRHLDDSIEGLKLGVPKEYFADGLEPGVKQCVDSALESYKKAGAEIIEISLPLTEYVIPVYYLIACAETSSNLSRIDGVHHGHTTENPKDLLELYMKSRNEGFGEESKRRIMLGTFTLSAGYFDAYYKKAQKVRTLLIEDYNKAFESVDLIVTPTSPFPAFKANSKNDDPMSMYLADIYTVSPSLAGLPTISIPCGFDQGLPVGMQLTGRYFDEQQVLTAAHRFQVMTDSK